MPLSVPVPANAVSGVNVTAAFWNAQVRDAVSFLLNPPHCVMYQSVVQSLANNTAVPITFDVNTVDSYTGHSVVTNTSRYTAQVAGWYAVSGVVTFTPNAVGDRKTTIAVNGVAINGSPSAVLNSGAATAPLVPTTAFEVFLNLGDYVELLGFQNSGGALNTFAAAPSFCSLTIRWCHA